MNENEKNTISYKRNKYDELTRAGKHSDAAKVAEEIAHIDCANHKSYELLFHAYRKSNNYQAAYDSIENGIAYVGNHALLNHLKLSARKDLNRVERFKSLYVERQKHKNLRCDVICMASNEAPYIAEFIHHYIHYGFNNIFVGINDTSKDSTLNIVENIQKVYPQVKVVDTNSVDSRYEQYSQGSYSVLWDYASRASDSGFSLVVDVDEFLVLPKKVKSIENYLKGIDSFDAMYFTYIDQTGCDESYSPPLKCNNPALAFSPWTKYIVCNSSEISELKPHTPIFNNIEGLVALLPSGAERTFSTASFGISFLDDKLSNTEHSGINFHEHPFIWHYRGRSELEYCFRCVQSWPGLPVSLYPNRQGFRVPSFPQAQEYVDLLENIVPPEYYLSLNEFINECKISHLIEAEILAKSATELIRVLDKLPDQVIQKEQSIWRKSFTNTKFIDYFEKRLELIESSI